nr:DUF2933 domain-containing protein [Tsuneonella aeria]
MPVCPAGLLVFRHPARASLELIEINATSPLAFRVTGVRRLPIATIGLMVFLAILGLFLILEHPDHLLNWLPFLIILLCPLMHMFMHRRHGGHGSSAAGSEQARRSRHF